MWTKGENKTSWLQFFPLFIASLVFKLTHVKEKQKQRIINKSWEEGFNFQSSKYYMQVLSFSFGTFMTSWTVRFYIGKYLKIPWVLRNLYLILVIRLSYGSHVKLLCHWRYIILNWIRKVYSQTRWSLNGYNFSSVYICVKFFCFSNNWR